MKRILFVIGQLRVGGVSKALIELLRCIEGEYDISLLCFDHNGAFFSDIPQSVHILPENNLLTMTERSAKDMEAVGRKYAVLRSFFSLATKLMGKKYVAKFLRKRVGKIPGQYDMAIAYAHPMPNHMFCNLGAEVVLDCADAANKAVFIHCDFAVYGGNCRYNRKLLAKFDKVVGVSKSVGQRVKDCVPEVASKVYTVQNCHDFERIREMSNIDPVIYTTGVSFITAARLSEEKGLLRCVPIFAKLKNENVDFEWHIVGGGMLEEPLKAAISEYGMEKHIFLEGQQTNPYRFMKNADYLLLPSFHEAAPMVFDEAAALGVPIISTRTLSADELVESRGIGVVCDNSDSGLEDAIRNALLRTVSGSEKKNDFEASNRAAVEAFIKMCEE